jgi:hypothetical protein
MLWLTAAPRSRECFSTLLGLNGSDPRGIRDGHLPFVVLSSLEVRLPETLESAISKSLVSRRQQAETSFFYHTTNRIWRKHFFGLMRRVDEIGNET